MATKLGKIIADFETQLTTEISVGGTTATLQSATDDDGVALPTGKYYLTVDKGNSQKEYFYCTVTGTAVTNLVSISRQGASTTGAVRKHRVGASVTITNFGYIKFMMDLLDGTTGFDSSVNLGYDGAPTSLAGNQFATVAYVLSVVSGGTVTFDTQTVANQVAGENVTINDVVYFKESDQRWYKADADLTTTFDQLQIGVTKTTASTAGTIQVAISGTISGFSGLTAGSKYYLSNTPGGITTTAGTYSVFIGWALSTSSILFSPYLKTLPTQKEKDAMAGGSTFGTPSSTNKFITQDIVFTNNDQTQSTQNSSIEFGTANTTGLKNKIAQSFIPAKTSIRGVTLYKSANSGTFTGTVTISLQTDSSGSPSGTSIATTTISNTNYNSITVGEFDAIFSTEYTSLTVGSLYWIVLESSTSDTSNRPNVGINTAGGYTNGSVKYNNSTDGWVSVATIDLYFKTLNGFSSKTPNYIEYKKTYTTSSIWTKGSNLYAIEVEVIGAGGGGAGGTSGSGGGSPGQGGSGGGGGGYAKRYILSSQLSSFELITIGTGGTGGATGIYGGPSGAGTNGGNTTFGSLVTGNGGGGAGATGGTAGAAGASGTSTINIFGNSGSTINGPAGGTGNVPSGGVLIGGSGGGTYYGIPGVNGTSGTFGAGGGGGAGGPSGGGPGATAGGAGGNGLVIITEYYL